jgi:threonine/homoserine/homoserine lactone efflux protein
VCGYLLYLAWTPWHHGNFQRPEAGPVTVRGVFLTTLLNPKALIFAWMLLPVRLFHAWAGVVPWLGVLSALIVTVGGCAHREARRRRRRSAMEKRSYPRPGLGHQIV